MKKCLVVNVIDFLSSVVKLEMRGESRCPSFFRKCFRFSIYASGKVDIENRRNYLSFPGNFVKDGSASESWPLHYPH